MTTKKQKRAEVAARREQREAELRASGLEAQRRDQENRRNKLRDSQREKHDKEHSWKQLDKNCVLCQDRLIEARRLSNSMET